MSCYIIRFMVYSWHSKSLPWCCQHPWFTGVYSANWWSTTSPQATYCVFQISAETRFAFIHRQRVNPSSGFLWKPSDWTWCPLCSLYAQLPKWSQTVSSCDVLEDDFLQGAAQSLDTIKSQICPNAFQHRVTLYTPKTLIKTLTCMENLQRAKKPNYHCV